MPAWLRTSAVAVGLACLAPARVASACPDCPPIRAARAAIADDPAFWTYVLLTALPFIVVAGIAAAAYRIGRPREVAGT